MSKITPQDVQKIAELARLELPEAKIESLTAQMNDILGYIEKLNQLDTEGVEPTSHPVPLATAWREDTPRPSPDPEKALENAPARDDRLIVVPKVIE